MNNETNKQKHFLVELQPVGRRIQISENKSLLEAAQLAGVDLALILPRFAAVSEFVEVVRFG